MLSVVLALVCTATAVIGVRRTLSAETMETSRTSRLLIEGTGHVRQAFWLRYRLHLGPGWRAYDDTRNAAIEALSELAALAPTRRSIRMLVLADYALGGRDWPRYLNSLHQARDHKGAAATDRELSDWKRALRGARNDRERVAEVSSRIRRMGLGWYELVALTALYENNGNVVRARRFRALALASTDRLTAVVLTAIAVGLIGLVAWLACGVYLIRSGWQRLRNRVNAESPDELTGNRLLFAGAMFFASLLTLRLIGPNITAWIGGSYHGEVGRLLIVGVSISMNILAILPAMAVVSSTKSEPRSGYALVRLVRIRPLKDIGYAILGHSMALPALAISLLISSLLFRADEGGMNPAVLEFAEATRLSTRLLLFGAAVILAPVIEEIVFRGILLRGLQSRYGFLSSAVITSAIFAILHPQLPMGFLSIFTLGLVFSTLVGITGSLWPAILAHGINNALVFVYLALYLGV